ncbi:MAG: protein kinase [Candidatus Promineofilum sp.]|nr:protein kinase [Promineifilum sp.]MBP9657210.1 protein kinase [Promineifilum sp.]
MTFQAGQSIKGYKVLERIGSGGYGAVYRAYQTTLGREVAIKVILPGLANRPEFIRRFEHEAQLVARLEHLHIVPLYDYWRDPQGAYLVMRWLRGGSLKDSLVIAPWDLNSAGLLLDQLAFGLTTAHAAGVVHRDLKPSNVLLDEEGNAYLADFGIATDIGDPTNKTREGGAIVGSPDYLSPEQARGQEVTPQTDIYCLGVTLYETLTGKHPFPDLTGVERLFKHINEPLPPIESLDPLVLDEVNAVIRRATMKNPRHRYENVLEMAAAYRSAAQLGELGRAALVESLTIREQEILRLITQGKANREIADALFIELSTVKWYIRQIYPKLGVQNRRQAILRGRELALLVGDDEESAGTGGETSVQLVLPAPVNPYKGLRPFEAADARNYFGRESLIRRLLERLKNHAKTGGSNGKNPAANGRFLAVVGPSGSGKSSLVRAGLVPALMRGELPGSDRWFIAHMTPGRRPLDELEVCLIRIAAYQPGNLRRQLERDENGLLRAADILLPRDDSELVLVIDQFEELFTLTTDEAERRHFLGILVAAVTDPHSRIRVVIALRADYYDRPLHYPAFGDLVRSHMETILPLSAEEVEQAIVLPAEQAGVACETGLAAMIIDDVLYQPGGLPLLQYALTELFEQREGRTLTRQAYKAIGGVTGALARRAEELFLEQDDTGREAIRQMFLRLTAVDEGKDTLPDTRRRVLRLELDAVAVDEDLVDDIISVYAAHRLLTLDHDPVNRRPTVEVAHEALLREWERLRFWLEESRDDLYQHRRLQILTQEWLDEDRDPGLLLSHTRLDQYASWAANTTLVLSHSERTFLDASLAARQDRQVEEETRRRRELETAQQLAEAERWRAETQAEAADRLRRRAVYLTFALVAAAILAFVALAAGRQATLNAAVARDNAAVAGTQEAIADEQRRIAEAERDSAEAAAATSANARATAEAEALQRATAVAAAQQERENAETHARLASARELSMAALSLTGRDAELGILLAMEAVNLTYTVDGFALPEAESALRQALMSLRQEQVLPGTSPGECQVEIWCSAVAYSEAGDLLAVSGAGNTASVFDAEGGELLFVVDTHTAPVTAVAFSPDGTRLATAAADGLAMVWQLVPGVQATTLTTPERVLDGHGEEVTDVVFSPDAALVATAGTDGAIMLWETNTGEAVATLAGHESSVRDVAFSPDGAELFSASSDFTARIWDVANGAERLVLSGHSDRLTDLAVSPDGSKLATASWDGAVKVWDPATGDELLSFSGDSARVYAVAFSPDGAHLAGGGTDAVINIWNAETGQEVLELSGHKGVIFNLAYAPDGERLASGADDGTVRTWDISRAGNREWLTLDGHTWVMFGVDFSPDGTQLATAGWDGLVNLWDARTGAVLGTIAADEWRKFSVEFSPDGRRLVTSAMNDSAVIWDLASGDAEHTFSGHGGPILDIALSPDGRWLVTVGEGQETPGLIQVRDTQTGELEHAWVGHDSSIERAAISPDGRLLATAGTDGTVGLWLLATGEPVTTLPDHGAPVNGVNFSHDGRLLATAGADNVARIWTIDGENVQPVTILRGHSSVVWDAVFSPDDATVATIGFDEAVKLWDVATGVELVTLPGEANNGREVAFSPDGVYLAVTTGIGLTRLYVIPIDELLAVAESRVTRSLSDQECRQYLHLEQGCGTGE